jgi:hypothetical protein
MPYGAKQAGAFAAVVLWQAKALCCMCALDSDFDSARKSLVIFAGAALENRTRCWSEIRTSDKNQMDALRHTLSVTRFHVSFSTDLPVGTDVLVFQFPYSTGREFYRTGEEHLVVTTNLNGVLLARSCPMIDGELERRLRSELSIPESFMAERDRPAAPFLPTGCAQPTSLQAAFDASDAVGSYFSTASCVTEDPTVVEHAVVTRIGWKGPSRGDRVTLRVKLGADEQYVPLPFEGELDTATGHSWPPAVFLRRENEHYVNDGCLVPLPPASLQEATDALARLLPTPQDTRIAFDTCAPPEPLTCSRISQAELDWAGQQLIAYYHKQSHDDKSTVARSTWASSPPSRAPRGGTCAGCTIPRHSRTPQILTPLLLMLGLVRRIFSRSRPA